jgi:hypothetical protein
MLWRLVSFTKKHDSLLTVTLSHSISFIVNVYFLNSPQFLLAFPHRINTHPAGLSGQLRHVIDERKLLAVMNSRFVLKLYGNTPHTKTHTHTHARKARINTDKRVREIHTHTHAPTSCTYLEKYMINKSDMLDMSHYYYGNHEYVREFVLMIVI